MVFIDDLALMLFTLPLISILIAYTTIQSYLGFRKEGYQAIKKSLDDSIIPAGILGLVTLIISLWGEFTWTLPGSYNILFYDVYLLMGIIILSYSMAVYMGKRLQTTGIFALFVGLITIYYGVIGFNLGLTQEPLALLGLYVTYGLAGILGYPVTVFLDRLKEQPSERRNLGSWIIVFVVFWIIVIVAGILGAVIGVETIPAHLAHAP
ncbi:MAG: DUF981 family protein [Metallosphaera sp.]|uniref:DUF981 family protein n=1 Tax=Metallosphaera cuprina (strain Ar-4) TaxID=1006006 RepID=F4G2P8_METCR|nr:DUF981 family protein [Metallosphaera cuprina]AEB95096.1 conserved hypothetical protein [Metallosphaera cuprina Ar-4]